MAKKKRKVNIPEGIVDYYAIYGIDRQMGTKEIRKQLLKIQGEIRSNMSNGALNDAEILKKLQESYHDIANAVKTFKTEERRKEYDVILDAAYEAGRINEEAQVYAEDLYEEIRALFLKGNYRGAIKKAMDALNNNARDYRIYMLLAQSYFALNEVDRSLNTVEKGLSVHPDNMSLLRAGARFANEGKDDFERAQKYVNRMLEIDPDSALAASEQSYLYVCNGKTDLAYKLIDEYMDKHPDDIDFRRDCAYDLVGYSYNCYTKDPNSDAYVIASQEDYQKCLDTCSKAASIYKDENTQEALESAQMYGQVEFNDENKPGIFWLFAGGIVYLLAALGSIDAIGILGFLAVSPVGILLIYSGIRLRQVSYRPYWQINKFILTGEREKNEKIYVMIGKIFTGYIKWSFKIAWEIVKFIWRMF
ncbi:MAG: hypothetical protein NC548_28940 [Lachnospiraceae bacterium]|nr:hypothetical protein [Lachnospiraceae bacterium]